MRYTTLPLLGAILLAAACTDQTPVGPSIDAARSSTAMANGSGPWAKVVEGETGPGSLYALYIPAEWNGDAIYYAHGIRPPGDAITLIDQNNFVAARDALGAKGYAFAYSSYSENGLAIKDGALRTHQLRGLLNAELHGQPRRNFLAGHSLGALVALELGQKFPTQYDGVLALCGMVGGTPLEVQYVEDVRALFDAYYPGALPGNAIWVPTPMRIEEIQAAVIQAITPTQKDPLATVKMFAIASTAQTPLAYVDDWNPAVPAAGIQSSPAFQKMVESLITALYYQNLGTPDVLGRTHGHSPYDNRNTTYTMATAAVPPPLLSQLTPVIQALIASLKDGVTRYDITPDAQNYLERNYEPTGRLQIPVVSVHNYLDPLVPYFHEPAFGAVVASAGSSGMLLQRGVGGYGHCNFTTADVVNSFQDLATWATTGKKPTS